jgi:hypothetical protein
MRQMAATIVATTIRYDALLPADSDTIEISAPDPEGNVVPHEVAVGGGSHSGRSMRLGRVVMAKAADQIVEKGARLAAWRLVHGVRAAARRSPALVHHRDQRGAVYREPARATWAAARAGRPRRSGPR